ncbi:3,9-dihydroxypterocarpan 6A-monooxygenase [Cicer arietinum]
MAFDGASVLFYIFSLLALLIFSFVINNKRTKNDNDSKIKPPPSPPSLPIIGHLHLIGSIIPKSFQTLSRLYGPLIQLNLGASTTLVVSNAQVAKQILKTHELKFINRPQFGSSHCNCYKGSNFITAPYGPYWRFMKKICVTKLLSTSQLGCFLHIREQEIEKLLKSLVVCSSDGRSTDLCTDLTILANNIFCRMTMGTTCLEHNVDAETILYLVREITHIGAKLSMGDVLGPLGKLDLFGYGKRLKKVMGEFDKILERIMEDHEERKIEDSQGDMMDILLQVYTNPNAEVRLTRNDIKALFLDIFLAGTDTTSVAMQWAMAEIMNNPRIMKKLKAEIDVVVGTKRLVKEFDVPNMPYLRAFVKEVLRLHPPAPLALRQSVEDCKINGYDIKAQTRTLINVYAIMRDPQSWVNPDEFIPERFLAGGDGINGGDYEHANKMDGDDFRHIPFGFGRRGCPGSSLALTVIQVTVGALIQCFDWKVKGRDNVNMEEGSSFSARLANPILCYPITSFNPFHVSA